MNIFGFDISLKRSSKTEPDWDRPVDRKIKDSYILPWEVNRPLSQTANYASLIAAYKSWVYICANKNATAVANANLKVYVKKKSKDQKTYFETKAVDSVNLARLQKNPALNRFITKGSSIEEVEEHPLYDLFAKVNPFISRFDLWELTTLYLEMVGNAYWYVVRDEVFGIPIQLWVMPAQNMQVVVSKENFISGYVFTRGVEKIPFTEQEIIHFKYPSLSSIFYGQGCLLAAMDAYDFEQSAKNYETTLMKNQGRPEGILSTDMGLTEPEFERLRTQFENKYGQQGRKGKPLLLEKGLKYTPLTLSPKEINFVVGRKLSREEIAAVFGVPISKLTTEKVNLANAFIGEKQYMEDTISPRLKRIEEKINERLMPMYDDGLFVVYDEVIPEDKEFEIKERESNLKNMVTTINMEREKMNLDPVKWGDVPFVPAGVAPLGSPQQQANGSMMNAKPEDEEDNPVAIAEEMAKAVVEAIKGKHLQGQHDQSTHGNEDSNANTDLHQSVLEPLLEKKGFVFLGHSNTSIKASHSKFPKQDGEGMLKDLRNKGDKRNLRVYKSPDSYRRPNTPEKEIHSMLYSDNKVQSFDVHGRKIK